MNKYYLTIIKPFADRLLSFVLLIILSPLLAILSFAILINLGSPVFFTQLRPGYKTRPFKLIKFRTMTAKFDKSGCSLPDEKRITRLGSILRSTSLDELPELINILRGEMSFIGPRPLLMEYLGHYSDEQNKRHDVKPGLTGWAQIKGRNSLSWTDKFILDVWYVNNRSIYLDFYIFLATIRIVLLRRGISYPGQATMSPFTSLKKNHRETS